VDDREPDTNVVRFRRRDDPGEAERQRLASTIFAAEDDVGTFSRGNLVPPAKDASPADEGAPPADPFFEDLQRPTRGDETGAPAPNGKATSTAAFFDELDSQSPAEMSETVATKAPMATMPGSARLPAELEHRRERRFDAGTACVHTPHRRRGSGPLSASGSPGHRPRRPQQCCSLPASHWLQSS
jgi:hypothetical protein